MARFVKGDVVVVPFPFSDLTLTKRRPALVLAALEGDDCILCQITSQQLRDRYSIELDAPDFASGDLKRRSSVRPNRLFTADTHVILYQVGHLAPSKVDEITEKVVEILHRG